MYEYEEIFQKALSRNIDVLENFNRLDVKMEIDSMIVQGKTRGQMNFLGRS